jgi:hypothetical protein
VDALVRAWVDQCLIGIAWDIGFGFYYAGGPNALIDTIPAKRQGISAAMPVFGSFGSALAVALFTPLLAAHPYKLIATPPGGKPITQVILPPWPARRPAR